MLAHLDTWTVLSLNGALRDHYLLRQIVQGLANNAIARGAPIFVPLVVIWFSSDRIEKRGRMILGLFGVCVATLASVLLQKHLHVDVRPFLDPRLHLYLPDPQWVVAWDRISSFPSDTAALCFSLSTVVFLQWRLAGTIAYGWSFLTAGICRMALGFHYPIDILGGIVLGVGTVYIFSKMRGLATTIQRVLDCWTPRLAWVHAAFFLFIAEAYMLFPAVQGAMHFFTRLAK